MDYSIIQYYSEHEKYKCGYCKKQDSNYSHGMWAHTMTASNYQDLIDRGWRRSGKFCYKPTNDIICCPMYTIRCRALEFKASKSQKKVLKKFNKYLIGQNGATDDNTRRMSNCSDDMKVEEIGGRDCYVENTKSYHNVDLTNVDIKDKLQKQNDPHTGPSNNYEETTHGAHQVNMGSLSSFKISPKGPDPAKGVCKKAKVMRRERKIEKLKQKGIDINQLAKTNNNKEKKIEDYINEIPDEVKRKLEVRLVRTTPPSAEWIATSRQSYEVYVKYQTIVHGDRLEKCTEPKFTDFLVESPLLEEYSETSPPCGYGSFHQQYWLENKLIAVGVIDILPKCVSSVYFFYDPQYMFLTLGTYGALREIAFTRHLQTLSPELKYYYMGFYIHSCPKMRYKGNYFPSDLLCPETYKWFDIKDCLPKLGNDLYSRFDPDVDSVDENYPNENVIMHIPVLYNNKIMFYSDYVKKGNRRSDDKEELLEYAQLVGAKMARRLIMVQ